MRALSDEDIRDFWAAHYRPANLVVAVAGDIAPRGGRGAGGAGLRPRRAGGPGGTRRHRRARASGCSVVQRDTSQAYVCLGVTGLPRDHADQWTLDLLNTVLGDGTSSRLFLTIREEAGLAYDVHSFQTDYADCGTLQVFMGVDAADVRAASGGRARGAGPAPRRAGARRRSWSGPATTPSAGSSCASRNRGPWPPSWAPRRRCTTGS